MRRWVKWVLRLKGILLIGRGAVKSNLKIRHSWGIFKSQSYLEIGWEAGGFWSSTQLSDGCTMGA